MDMEAVSGKLESGLYSEGLHSQNWTLPQTLKTSFSSAKEVIHSKGETLYLYLRSSSTQTTKQNTWEGELLPSSPHPEENNMESCTCGVFKTAPADELRLSMPDEISSQSKTRVSHPKNRKRKRKEERSGKVTKRVCNKNSCFCAARLTKKVPHKLLQNSMKVPHITPGTVLVHRTGPHQGKQVVFLKHLPSGLLLLTGPFASNSAPLSRVSPNSVSVTASKVDISGLSIPDTVTDGSLRRRRRLTESESQEGRGQEMETLQMEQRERGQRVVDSQVHTCVRKAPQVRRSLSSGLHYPDLLESWMSWIILLFMLLILHFHTINIDLLDHNSM